MTFFELFLGGPEPNMKNCRKTIVFSARPMMNWSLNIKSSDSKMTVITRARPPAHCRKTVKKASYPVDCSTQLV